MTLRSDRIIQLRKEMGVSQTRLADILGATPNQISKYENGHTNPPVETLSQLAEVFNTTTDYLLGRSDVPHPGAEPDAHPSLSPAEADMLRLMRTRDERARAKLVEAVRLLWDITPPEA